ncbi:MarR family transcriptional regulator [Streptomyces sp. NBC_00442]|uniref:MarR family winged helix-turn-helix transcriptional regulator n=1 Tax=Streptomyces sp. NBC_00442 TaxID=2903651 RepID=UPI002E1F5402
MYLLSGSDGQMDRAGSSADSPDDLVQQVLEAAETLIVTWNEAAQGALPRLSSLQLQALTVARRSPGINLTGLAERVGAAPPTASRLCDRLEAAGLLERRRGTTSRREIGLILTPQGLAMLEDLAERRLAAINQVLRHVPVDQREALRSGLVAFAEATKRAADPGSGD